MAKMKWQAQCDSVLLELDRVLRGIEESQCALDPPVRSEHDFVTEDKELIELYRNATLQAEDDSPWMSTTISLSPMLDDDDNILLCSDQEDPTCEDIVLEEKSILSVVFNSSRSSSLKSSPSVNKRSINSDIEDDNASLISDISKPEKGGKYINSIFDNGITPPIPPKRKRKGTKESINQIYLNDIICPECNESVCDSECLDQKLDKEICELESMKLYYEEEARKCSEANASLYDDLLYRNEPKCCFNLDDSDSNYESSGDSPGRGGGSPYPRYCDWCDSGQLSTVEEEEDEFDELVPQPPEIQSIQRGYATSSPLPFPVPQISSENSSTHTPPNDDTYSPKSPIIEEVTFSKPEKVGKYINSIFDNSITPPIIPPSFCEEPKEHLFRKPPTFQVVSLKTQISANETAKSHTPPPARYLPVQRDVVFWLRNIRHQCHDEDEWYASNDAEGRVYFYPENSEESAWSLPEVQKSQGSTTPAALSTELVGVENGDRAEGEEGPSAKENTASAHGGHRAIARNAKTRSLVLLPNKSPDEPTLGRNWPQLNASNMNVIREGSLWRTKFTEGGRRCRKNWAHCHAVLTQLHLLLYRDYKIYLQVGAPELSVELTGANIESGEHLSSRKNVFLITTLLGLQVLLQSDNQVVAQQWHLDIEKAIDNLPTNRQEGSPNVKHNRATRSKSVKVKGSTPSPGSIEDLTDDRQTKIRARLKKFFHRRPTREQLVTKGIYKDEPVFGRELAQVCAELDSSGTGLPGIGRVPPFVLRCIHAIESNPENLITDGLYRVSGNLSQVQTIRLQVDQNNLSAIDQEEDVHVLAGSLKLFFRELKQPLLPWEKFRHLLEDSSPKATKDRLNELSQILKTLPQPNLDTLRFLLKHLLKVVEHKQKNRMHIENLAIVWGPTLLAAEDLLRSTMAIDLMQQNQLLELLLRYFDQLF